MLLCPWQVPVVLSPTLISFLPPFSLLEHWKLRFSFPLSLRGLALLFVDVNSLSSTFQRDGLETRLLVIEEYCRMDEVGRHLWRLSSPNPCSRRATYSWFLFLSLMPFHFVSHTSFSLESWYLGEGAGL